jgi:hypothetical protein
MHWNLGALVNLLLLATSVIRLQAATAVLICNSVSTVEWLWVHEAILRSNADVLLTILLGACVESDFNISAIYQGCIVL